MQFTPSRLLSICRRLLVLQGSHQVNFYACITRKSRDTHGCACMSSGLTEYRLQHPGGGIGNLGLLSKTLGALNEDVHSGNRADVGERTHSVLKNRQQPYGSDCSPTLGVLETYLTSNLSRNDYFISDFRDLATEKYAGSVDDCGLVKPGGACE